jgi:hypothetical protein
MPYLEKMVFDDVAAINASQVLAELLQRAENQAIWLPCEMDLKAWIQVEV